MVTIHNQTQFIFIFKSCVALWFVAVLGSESYKSVNTGTGTGIRSNNWRVYTCSYVQQAQRYFKSPAKAYLPTPGAVAATLGCAALTAATH